MFTLNHNAAQRMDMHPSMGHRLYVRQFVELKGLYGEGSFSFYGNLEFNPAYYDHYTEEEIKEEIRNLLHERCGCMYDCCGHWNGWGAPIRKIGKFTWLVTGYYCENY